MKGVRRLTLRESHDMYERFVKALAEDPRRQLCGVVIKGGPNLEPLACAYPPNHGGDHSWATLPTWTPNSQKEEDS